MVPPDSDRVPPAPPYSGTGPRPGVVSRTGLSPSTAPLSRGVPLRRSDRLRPPYNPARASTPAVWAIPRSLAATWGVTVVFLSSAYLDVSVRRVGNLDQVGVPPARRVSPFGHPRIKGRSRLPAAFRSLPRPSSPPGAKASPVRPPVLVAHRRLSRRHRGHGTIEYSSLLLVSRFLFQVLFACHFARPHALACAPATDFAFVSFLPSCQRAFPHRASASPPPSLAGRVENKGVEPLTPSLQSWCSSQLS